MPTATVLIKQFYLISVITSPSTPTFVLQPLSFFNINWWTVGFDQNSALIFVWCRYTCWLKQTMLHWFDSLFLHKNWRQHFKGKAQDLFFFFFSNAVMQQLKNNSEVLVIDREVHCNLGTSLKYNFPGSISGIHFTTLCHQPWLEISFEYFNFAYLVKNKL